MEIGGQGRTTDIYPLVTKKFPQINEKDLQGKLKSGGNRWKNRIQWAKAELVRKGDIYSKNERPWGIWAITDKGRDRVKTIKGMVDARNYFGPPEARETPEDRNQATIALAQEKPHINTFTEEISKLVAVSQRLSTFQASWVTREDFDDHIKSMKNYFSTYKEIWITGHFSNSFAMKIKGLCKKYPGCDLRILSIYTTNKKNLDALNKIKADGAKVKIHSTLHSRIFIGYNEETSTWKTIIGSYDYNREGISGENINAGISSQDIEVIQKARDFFKEQWYSSDAQDI